MNNEQERTWKEAVVAYFWCCTGIYQERLRKIIQRKLRRDIKIVLHEVH
jgi:hypothetical protein